MGCAYYEDDPCIDCLLCLATNEEERNLASRRKPRIPKSRAEKKRGPIRKIAFRREGRHRGKPRPWPSWSGLSATWGYPSSSWTSMIQIPACASFWASPASPQPWLSRSKAPGKRFEILVVPVKRNQDREHPSRIPAGDRRSEVPHGRQNHRRFPGVRLLSCRSGQGIAGKASPRGEGNPACRYRGQRRELRQGSRTAR